MSEWSLMCDGMGVRDRNYGMEEPPARTF